MKTDEIKTPKKGAVKKLREFHEKNRGKPSSELLEILKVPTEEKPQDRQSAKPQTDRDLEI